MNYLSSSKGEKHIWFEGYFYQNHRQHHWRCVSKGCNARFHTIGSQKEEEIIDQPTSHSCKPVTLEEFLCKRAVTKMKDRVKDEQHVPPSEIYKEELVRLVKEHNIDQSIVDHYIRKYDSYKSTFLKLRIRLKTKISQCLLDLNSEDENLNYNQTKDKQHVLRPHSKDDDKPLFMISSINEMKPSIPTDLSSTTSFVAPQIGSSTLPTESIKINVRGNSIMSKNSMSQCIICSGIQIKGKPGKHCAQCNEWVHNKCLKAHNCT